MTNEKYRLRLKGVEMINYTTGYGIWIGKIIKELMLGISLLFLLIIIGKRTYILFTKND